MAKRKQWLLVIRREESVSDQDVFGVSGDAADSRVLLDGLDRSLAGVGGEGDWSRPPGSSSPNSTRASAVPNCSPGYQTCRTAATLSSHGIKTGPGVLSTTTVWGLLRATSVMSLSWSPGSASDCRSIPSPDAWLTITTAASHWAARAAASSIKLSGGCQPSRTSGRSPNSSMTSAGPVSYSTRMVRGWPGDQMDDGLQSVQRPVNKADRLACSLRYQRTVQVERALAGDAKTEPVVTVLGRCQHGRPGGMPLWSEPCWRVGRFYARLYPGDALAWRLAGAVDILGQDTWAGRGAGTGRGRQEGRRDRRKRYITPGPLSMLDSDGASRPLPDPASGVTTRWGWSFTAGDPPIT